MAPETLDRELLTRARAQAKLSHRTVAQQISHWAEVGRSVQHIIDENVILGVKTGLMKIEVKTLDSPKIDPRQVFAELERDRADGTLTTMVTKAPYAYQASTNHPGLLDRIHRDGRVETGTFENGEFTPRV